MSSNQGLKSNYYTVNQSHCIATVAIAIAIHSYIATYNYLIGFAKTVPNHTRIEIQFIGKATLLQYRGIPSMWL